MVALVLAHQGGWDEALVVALPILAFGAILMGANRRAAAAYAAASEEERTTEEPSTTED